MRHHLTQVLTRNCSVARHVLKGPREMFDLRRVFAFWAAVAFVVSLASEVRAQVTGGPAVVLPPNGVTRRANRGGNLMNTQINFDDCNVDETIDFSVSISAPNSAWTLQVWAGANCDNQTYRVTPTVLNCWQIGPGLSVGALNPPAIPISVRDILYGRTLASGASTGVSASGGSADADAGIAGADSIAGASATAGSGGTSGTAGVAPTTLPPDQAACTPKDAATGAQNISVYFMMVDSSSAIQGTFATWAASYKLLAPPPPDVVSAGIGENLLPIRFSYSTPSTDNSINGYNFYCNPPPGTAAAADAGVLPVDGGVPVTSCDGVASTKLMQGMLVTGLDNFRCGGAGKSATGGNATGLVDGVKYDVAVATTDSYNNVGTLSTVTCAVPQPVTGFFKAYQEAGGRAGGGFCSFSRHREPFALAALLGLASCLLLRRRRAA
jgi:hypothetical protein